MALPAVAGGLIARFGGLSAAKRALRGLRRGGAGLLARRRAIGGVGRRRGRRKVSLSKLMMMQTILGKNHPAVKLLGFRFVGLR